MKITRYLWINNLSNKCEESDIRQTFQSHGKIQTVRIHKNNNSRGAIVAFIDCKSSTKAYESVKTLLDVPLKLEYCEANGEPGINALGINCCEINQKNGDKNSSKPKTSVSSRSRSNSSNTSSFGSSIDDCSKYPAIQQTTKRVDENSNNCDGQDKQCLNKELCGLLIENLSQRSSDTSLREGLFHEYKKHGKITSVTVMGQASGRHAIISFKRSEDMEKAFEASQGKIFFGNQIRARQHNGFSYIDPDLCPPEHAMDEYHPKATKTLFVGKLATGAVTETDLRKTFKKYGDIIDIDIKTQSNQPDTSFAFVQYYDIASVVRALRNQDSIKIDGKSVKLGFGKSQPTNCLWIGNLARSATDGFLRRQFRRYGPIVLVIPDGEYSCALVQFDCVEDAQCALTDTRERGNAASGPSKRMQVDYASNEYQMAFMNRLRKSCQFDSHDLLKNYADPYQTEKIQNLLISYTKYLGLLDEARPQSFDRYDAKSDFDDYDDLYSSTRQSRSHRKSQRLYGAGGDNYGLDDDYSDDYRYSKPSAAGGPNRGHYDDYSPGGHSPARYSRSNKFTSSTTNTSSDQYGSRKTTSNYNNRYNNSASGDYYDCKNDASNYYTPASFGTVHSSSSNNHNNNRSFSPSPSSSGDYCVDNGSNARYNSSSKRYRRSSKDFRSSRSKIGDIHDGRASRYERTSENRTWNKSHNRYDYDGYGSKYRSKSGSRTRLSASNSPRSHNSQSQQRNYASENNSKKSRMRKSNNNDSVRSSASKTGPKTSSGSISSVGNNKSTVSSGKLTSDSSIGVADTTKPNTASASNAASQSADTLSKLERERAKLLQELSMLSEDATIGNCSNTASVKPLSKPAPPALQKSVESDARPDKSQKKRISPQTSESSQSQKRSSSNHDTNKLSSTSDSVPIMPASESKSIDILNHIEDKPKPPHLHLHVDCVKIEDINVAKPLPMEISCKVEPQIIPSSLSTNITKEIVLPPLALDLLKSESSSEHPIESASPNQCRDPRLSSSLRPIIPPSPFCSMSPLDNPMASPDPPLTALVTPPVAPTAYKDSTSDSDLEHFNNLDSELDKRIRELDAKMNRSEQTVRTLDYSKFRIRKKVCENVTSCATVTSSVSYCYASGLISSPPCLATPVSLTSNLSSSLLDVVGYSSLNRDNSSNTSEFIKTMLNQTKSKSYHLLTDALPPVPDTLACNFSPTTPATSSVSSLPFRTVDLGANDIERRTLFSRYATIGSVNLCSLIDTKLSVDTTLLSPRFTPSANCSISSSKMPSTLTVSPTATISSTTSTPTIVYDTGQPMKSILKKSMVAATSIPVKHKPLVPQEPTNHAIVDSPKCLVKRPSSNCLKRKSQSESDDSMDYCKPPKKTKIESVLDESLFHTYPSTPVKKVKKSVKNEPSIVPLHSKHEDKKRDKARTATTTQDRRTTCKKPSKLVAAHPSNGKCSKLYKPVDSKKASMSKKCKSKSGLKTINCSSSKKSRPAKSVEKAKKLSKRSKDRHFYDTAASDEPDDHRDDLSDFDGDFDKDTVSSDNYESMYDKIKRRNSNKSASSGKKKRAKHAMSTAHASSDGLDSDDSDIWLGSKSSKKCAAVKRKRARLSDLSSSHFSDSNSCKTTPCGKSLDHTVPDQTDTRFYHIKPGDDNKDESVTDESKAPAESFNLSSPHNSSQCSSPKYGKDIVVVPVARDVLESVRTRSQHRPNDGPLKKRPIAEPIVLSEDLPFLEKQPDDEFLASSPTSINEEPPSQLEPMYDMPACHQTNVMEEVVLEDHHSLDVVEVEYGMVDSHVDTPVDSSCHGDTGLDVVPHTGSHTPLSADVDSASHILMTMKTQPALDPFVHDESDQQSVAEHLISLAQNAPAAPCLTDLSVSSSDGALTTSPQTCRTANARPANLLKHKDYEVTIYVKNIIDKIRKETDLANSQNKDRLACKRPKKPGPYTPKPSQECRPLLPLDTEAANRTAVSTTVIVPVESPNCVVVPAAAAPAKPQEWKRGNHTDESASTPSTGKRTRHNSARSDGQLQSLDETIDNVVRSSMSSSASDAVSNRSTVDGDGDACRADLSTLEETMNEVIHKMSSLPPCTVSTPLPSTPEPAKLSLPVSQLDPAKLKKPPATTNHVKPPLYQLATGGMSGIANLVLGIPSILTVNTLVNQAGQQKIGSQLALSVNKPTPLGPSQGVQAVPSVQSTVQSEVMLTKLNSLTPIVIPAPLRNLAPMGQPGMAQTGMVVSRPVSNPVCAIPVDQAASKLINASLTASAANKASMTSGISVVARSPLAGTAGLNLSKLSPSSVDAINNYLLMHRQTAPAKPKLASDTQSGPPNVSGHSIILSQLTNANSVLSPITTAYLTAPINRSTSMLQALPTSAAPSVIIRPMNIPYAKFDEKDDWLKQNHQQLELNYPIRWTGKLCLKNDEVFVQMHMLAGNEDLIKNSMSMISNGQMLSQPLRIVQRMRLEPNQLEGLQRRLTRQLEFCTCLTLAGGDKSDELSRTSSILNDNFIKYLQEKSAAGIINICIPDSQQNAYVIHIFPPCEFSDNQLKHCSAKLYDKLKEESVPYLLVVITTV